jgi:hypothetical protein
MKEVFLYLIFGIECILGGFATIGIMAVMIFTIIKKIYRKIVYKASFYD